MPEQNVLLLPRPRHIAITGAHFALTDRRLILLDGSMPGALRFSARRFQQSLHDYFGLTWELVASKATPASQIALTLRAGSDSGPAEGYELSITPAGIEIAARSAVGVFHGVSTLIQVLATADRPSLPTLNVRDWPDFPVRGVMLDVSRDKVPSMDTLCDVIDLLASWKINHLQLYTEHTFAYRNHPEVWAEASPLTGEEILDLDAYCRERCIELVPNQNCFGHMHRWLRHARYARLAETSGEFDVPWGRRQGPFSLCPLDPGSLKLVRSLLDELLPHFTSRMFNAGCDETFDLGQGRSREVCVEKGKGRVYLEFLRRIASEVHARGHTLQFWGDIVLLHPELIPELPENSIALAWGYEANHPFLEQGCRFRAAGIPFYVCPGTSSWCSVAGRTDNALGNLRNAAENGHRQGASGYLNTDWGDDGHWQHLPISYLGLAMGAAYAWAYDANRDLDPAAAVSRHAFRDPSRGMGQVAYALGNVYRVPGVEFPNASILFRVLQSPLERVRNFGVTQKQWERTLQAIDEAMAPLADSRVARADAALIAREFALTARLLRHACHRALLAGEANDTVAAQRRAELAYDMRSFIPDYEAVWLARNRAGGLVDSVSRLASLLHDYGPD